MNKLKYLLIGLAAISLPVIVSAKRYSERDYMKVALERDSTMVVNMKLKKENLSLHNTIDSLNIVNLELSEALEYFKSKFEQESAKK